ncbi:MAG: DciA family protein [Candidatus Peregrinibacteria bacterium]
MEKLSDIVQRRLHQYQLGGESRASQVLFHAQKFFHHHFIDDPNSVRPLKFQNAILWVGVEHASLAQEVRGISPKLLEELKIQYGATTIKQIRTKDLTNQ